MGRRTNNEEPLIDHASAPPYPTARAEKMTFEPLSTQPTPRSPTLSDMEMEYEIEMDIELGNGVRPSASRPPKSSPPIMPEPGEGGPLVPGPPVAPIPPKKAISAHANVLSELRRRSGSKMAHGPGEVRHIEYASGRAAEKGTRRADDALESPYYPKEGGWSKQRMYEHTIRKVSIDAAKKAIQGSHSQTKKQPPLVYPFMQLSLSPSKPKPKLAPKVKAYTPAAEKKEQRGAITRFLPPNRDEAFIAFMPNSAEETIALFKSSCPSLAQVPSEELALALHFDGSPSWVKNVLFRVLPDTWPHAVTDVLPLIHIKHTPKAPLPPTQAPAVTKVSDADLMGAFEVEGNNSMWRGKPDQTDVVGHGEPGVLAMLAKQKHQKWEQAQEKSKTWDDLVREGALLGIHQSELSHLAVHYGSKL